MTPDAFLPYRAPRSSATQDSRFVEGEIHEVTDAGVTFTVKDWDGGRHVFGPAPWPRSLVEPVSHSHPVSVSDTYTGGGSGSSSPVEHTHPPTVPTRGARALVLFLGDGIGNPWVVGWWA